ncbi:WecB/TagA/CpsF family glycosyltransferase [Haloferula sargassicola]|uniref:WecB/TagA/CpsF family glycosyltransferase n=1 Tax=Haloferula sargassicola TaxID=490096 RepID=UPI0033653B79
MPPPIVMMGVPFDQLTTPQALEIAEEMIASGRPHLLATANVDFLAQVQEDEALQQILVDADLIFCDGTPLVWMSKLLGDPLPERLAGSDMVPLLLDLAQDKGFRVFFLGGRDEVVAVAGEKILERWPKLKIAGMYSPPFAPLDRMDHEDICRRVRESGADMLFVSFGCPKQEKWLALNYRRAGVPLAIGVGATIDFLAGTVKRAPVWMRKCGLEWLFRVLQEPKRLAGRYWTDIRVVLPGLLKQWLRMRSDADAHEAVLAAPAIRDMEADAPKVVVLPERLDVIAARDASLWPEGEHPTLVLDATRTNFLDSTGTGKLVRFARTARERGGRCILAGASETMLGTLQMMRLRTMFTEVATLEEAFALAKSA